MILATVVIAGSVVGQNLRAGRPAAGTVSPFQETKWREVLPVAQSLGGEDGTPITIIEFTDLECPVCREFHNTVTKVIERHPGQVRLMYVPFPLSIHRSAIPAANAADCTTSPEELGRWIASVYRSQDSLGLKPWATIAAEAGIQDTARIAGCAGSTDTARRVLDGLALGERLDVHSTPTVIVNGWRFLGAPALKSLDSLVTSLIEDQD